MTTYTYKELGEALFAIDKEKGYPQEADENPEDQAESILGEIYAPRINSFLKEKGFISRPEVKELAVNLEKLPEIKAVAKEIWDAYCSINKGKTKTYHEAYRIFGQWGLLTFMGVGKHPFFSDDGVTYVSDYILQIIAAIEYLQKDKRKVA